MKKPIALFALVLLLLSVPAWFLTAGAETTAKPPVNSPAKTVAAKQPASVSKAPKATNASKAKATAAANPIALISTWFIPNEAIYTIPDWQVATAKTFRWETPGIIPDSEAFLRRGAAAGWKVILHGPRAGVDWIELF